MERVGTFRGVGQYVASEAHRGVLPPNPAPRVALYLQGSHSLADSVTFSLAGCYDVAQALARSGYLVLAGDLSQTTSQGTYGSDTARSRAGSLRTFAQGTLGGASGKVWIFAGSGGVTAAANYARQNPTNVAAIYATNPLLDVQDFHDNRVDVSITAAEVEAAYGGLSAYNAAMPAHNPAASGNQAAMSGVAWHIDYATDDPYIPTSSVTGFKANLEAAGGTCEISSLGAVGHTATGIDPDAVVAFFQAHA